MTWTNANVTIAQRCTTANRIQVPRSRGKRRATHNTPGASSAQPYQKVKLRMTSAMSGCGFSANSRTNW